MTGICASIGSQGGLDFTCEKEAMVARLPGKADNENLLVLTDGFLYLNADRDNNYFCDDEYAVLIDGSIYWEDEGLVDYCRANGEASSVVFGYKKYNDAVLNYLRGHYSIVLFDKRNQVLVAAIDRVGTKALCYSITANKEIILGTTTSSVSEYKNVSKNINNQAIFDYIYFAVVPSPETIYENIYKLEPAQFIKYRKGEITKGRHWTPKFEEHNNLKYNDLKDGLIRNTKKAVERSMDDKNVGAFLSGGIDSTSVVCFMAELSDAPPRCFSMGFSAEGFDEMEYARLSAEYYRAELNEYYVKPSDIVDVLPDITKYYDEPFGNSSVIPTYLCAKFAKSRGIDTLLAGDGGDELFAGNERYVKQLLFDYYKYFPAGLAGVIKYLARDSMPVRNKYINKLNSYVLQASLPMPERMETYNIVHRMGVDALFEKDFLKDINTDGPIENLRNIYNGVSEASLLNKMLYTDWKFTLADNDLRKVGRMCDLAGIKVNYPMLDDCLIDFSMRVPSKLKLKYHQLRYFYKRAMVGTLPQQTINKSKHGFGLPFGQWLKESKDLQELVYSTLNGFRKRGILNERFLDDIIKLHQEDHANYYGSILWVIFLLAYWMDLNNI